MTALGSLRGRVDAIVIGTSTGGVETLSVALPALPARMAPAVFVVLHLIPARPSLLVAIFQPKCTVPVREAQDKDPVESGTVYFAPPDYHLLVGKGPELALSVDALVNYSRPSIDVLFESAADVYGPRLLGIILSGASQDGASGLEAVRRAGGITVVQRPESAIASFMPASALKRGPADAILSPVEIAELLSTLMDEDGK